MQKTIIVEPRFDEVAGDCPNLFVKWSVRYTVEPRFNEPPFNEVLNITNSQSYSKMYGRELRYNADIIRKHKQNLPRYNELQCQHATEDKF